MRILMCSPNNLRRELGAPKVLIELAEALREIGVTCDVVAPRDYGAGVGQDVATRVERGERLRDFIRARAADFDVFDYDHEELPYPRADFDPRPLMVARSVLLVDHLRAIPRGRLFEMLARLRLRRPDMPIRFRRAQQTMRAADLINVANEQDKESLVADLFPPQRVVVLPYGLSDARRQEFARQCGHDVPPGPPCVAFVGTFNSRKGSHDLPKIVAAVRDAMPDARFRLLGTNGRYTSEPQLRRFFPTKLQEHIEIVPKFPADELPRLLSDCAIGLFPSYYEGFGFGVLEMLAAAIPVMAYDAPGPPMMLPREWLVPPGDVSAISQKLIVLLRDRDQLARARVRARECARPFDWTDIACRTLQAYEAAVARRAAHE
jgi:glycosyltransferase involved in cell wall biosynthesis